MPRFQTKISKARFSYSPFSGQQMAEFGEELLGSVNARLDRGLNANDQPAAPLKPRYAKFKQRRYPPAIRNLRATGRTRRSAKVLSANQNKAVIGFTDPEAEKRAAFANRRERMWGASPNDMEFIRGVIAGERPVKALKVA